MWTELSTSGLIFSAIKSWSQLLKWLPLVGELTNFIVQYIEVKMYIEYIRPAWSRIQHRQLRSPTEDALVSTVFGALSALEALCDNAMLFNLILIDCPRILARKYSKSPRIVLLELGNKASHLAMSCSSLDELQSHFCCTSCTSFWFIHMLLC